MESHTVKRSFKIDKSIDAAIETEIQEGLNSQEGVLNVYANRRGKKVTVEYDLYKTQFSTIENAMAKMGYGLSSNWFHALQHNWLRFGEENEIANLKHKPHCCNKSPR
ncbi:MAG: cation transporter [Alphaproteobacteria bacterium]|nr:cation transporter [Alphaproteobacteria bacterium]